MRSSLTTKRETAMLKKYSKGIVLEIGTYCGASALTLAKKADHVHTVDIYQHTDPMGKKTKNINFDYEKVKEKIAGKNITAYQSDSCDPELLKDYMFDVIFIDGDHKYPGVHRDFCRWYHQLKKNGIMMFHDYDLPRHTGVVRQVNNAITEGLLKKVAQVDSLIVCRKA